MPLLSAKQLLSVKQFQPANLEYLLFPGEPFDFLQVLGAAEFRPNEEYPLVRGPPIPRRLAENLHNTSLDLGRVRDTPSDRVYKISNVERGGTRDR
jgi:hypothetical protein